MTPIKIAAWSLVAAPTARNKGLGFVEEVQDSLWSGEFIISVFMSCTASSKQAALSD